MSVPALANEGYDQVAVTAANGDPARQLTRKQFEALPLDERVRLILGKRLKFYRATKEIPIGEALKTY